MSRSCVKALLLLVAVLMSGCPKKTGSGPITIPTPSDFPTTATVCTPYSYTFVSPATITAYSSTLPTWLDFGSGPISNTISGTPNGNDFGTFTVSGSGAIGAQTGTVSGAITVPKPMMTVTGGPFDVLLTGSPMSNTITIAVAPSSPSCTYTLTMTKRDWATNQIHLQSGTLTFMGGATTLQIALETDAPGDGAVIIKIVPTGTGASPVATEVPVHAHD
jgi:hypothetical protein